WRWRSTAPGPGAPRTPRPAAAGVSPAIRPGSSPAPAVRPLPAGGGAAPSRLGRSPLRWRPRPARAPPRIPAARAHCPSTSTPARPTARHPQPPRRRPNRRTAPAEFRPTPPARPAPAAGPAVEAFPPGRSYLDFVPQAVEFGLTDALHLEKLVHIGKSTVLGSPLQDALGAHFPDARQLLELLSGRRVHVQPPRSAALWGLRRRRDSHVALLPVRQPPGQVQRGQIGVRQRSTG